MITLKKAIEQGFSGKPDGLYDVLTEIQTSIAAIEALNGVCGATIVVGAAHTDTIAATIQLTDYLGADIAVSGSVLAYFTDDAAGLDISTTALTTELAIVTDGDFSIIKASTSYILTSEADGDIGITISYTTGAKDLYLVIVLPNGKKIVSTKFEFTA